jgi:hypothetical protein
VAKNDDGDRNLQFYLIRMKRSELDRLRAIAQADGISMAEELRRQVRATIEDRSQVIQAVTKTNPRRKTHGT